MVMAALLFAVGVPLKVTGIDAALAGTAEVVVTVIPVGALNQLEISVSAGKAVLTLVLVSEMVAVLGARPTLVQPLTVTLDMVAAAGPA